MYCCSSLVVPLCCCIVVPLYYCTLVLLYCCAIVVLLLYPCIIVLLYCYAVVLLYPCVVVLLYYSTTVVLLLYNWNTQNVWAWSEVTCLTVWSVVTFCKYGNEHYVFVCEFLNIWDIFMDRSLHAVGWLVRTVCFLTAIRVVPVVHSSCTCTRDPTRGITWVQYCSLVTPDLLQNSVLSLDKFRLSSNSYQT